MILDELTKFGTAVDLSQVVGTYVFPNQVDLGLELVRDIGEGQPVYVVINVTEVFAGGGATVDFQVVSDDTAALASPTIHVTTSPIAVAGLPLGKKLVLQLPAGNAYQRFLGVRAVIAGATTTTGAASAHLSLDSITNKAYPDAQN